MKTDYTSITVAVFYFLVFGGMLFIIFKIIQEKLSCIFTEKYSEIKKQHPRPLKTLRWRSGSLGAGWPFNFRINNMLKVEIYPYMLLVSAVGRALCLPYDRYIFFHKQMLFMHYLFIENVPMKNQGIFSIFFGSGETTVFKIFLSAKEIKEILELAHQK